MRSPRWGRVLGLAVLVIATVVTATVMLTYGVQQLSDAVTALLLGVSLAVAAVPEGLPTILSVVLALGVQRMAERNAIVKKLSSVETLGSASVVCSDKTGTLTRGEMTIGRVVTPLGQVTVSGAGYRPEGGGDVRRRPLAEPRGCWAQAERVLTAGSLAGNATLTLADGDWVVQGDPTEASFLVAETKLGLGDRRAGRYRRVGEVPFTSERKLMTSSRTPTAHGPGAPRGHQRGSRRAARALCAPWPSETGWCRWTSRAAPRSWPTSRRCRGEAFRTLGVASRRLEVDAGAAGRRVRSSRTSSTPVSSGSSTRRGSRRRAPSRRPAGPAYAS